MLSREHILQDLKATKERHMITHKSHDGTHVTSWHLEAIKESLDIQLAPFIPLNHAQDGVDLRSNSQESVPHMLTEFKYGHFQS
jgi:hypothetical protein